MRQIAVGAILSLLIAPLSGQDSTLSRDATIPSFTVPNALAPCGIDERLMRLTYDARVFIGPESKPECFRNPMGALRFLDPTISEIQRFARS
jgi:hypothetical protein